MNTSSDTTVFLQSEPTKYISTHDKGDSSTVEIVCSSHTTESNQEFIQIISLGIPDNETLDEAENDMEQLTQHSLQDWDV